MKKQSAKRVLILDDLNSDTIEQAIFILKEAAPPAAGEGIVSEANRIVGQYIRQVQAGQYRPPKPKKRWLFGRGDQHQA